MMNRTWRARGSIKIKKAEIERALSIKSREKKFINICVEKYIYSKIYGKCNKIGNYAYFPVVMYNF